jgi:hypothetical protein
MQEQRYYAAYFNLLRQLRPEQCSGSSMCCQATWCCTPVKRSAQPTQRTSIHLCKRLQ